MSDYGVKARERSSCQSMGTTASGKPWPGQGFSESTASDIANYRARSVNLKASTLSCFELTVHCHSQSSFKPVVFE